jgi:hypothetical protein
MIGVKSINELVSSDLFRTLSYRDFSCTHSPTVTSSENSMKIILLPLFDLEYLRNLTRLSDQ